MLTKINMAYLPDQSKDKIKQIFFPIFQEEVKDNS